ncbi:YfbM family protein [Herbaspirillum sp. SJZ107]|uniref:YfbM family protein n=1 Tax=Herbaspirillum sp. SJZ107 TaxID=2572881 RepID=UPI00116A5A2C|nr:YfbM family protein [Herbaspirillum sp. SJZ107]TQK06764.1 uncharacterized protein DUF1877 [Herbaspirillum sp. SJZ107]
MGMTLTLYSIGEQHADAIIANPPLAWKVLAYDDPEWAEETMANAGVSTNEAASLQLDEGDVAETDLDKAWHGIHYLLTGTAWGGEAPYNFLLEGGVLLGDEDDTSEPAPRLLRKDEVEAIHHALAALTADTLRERFDPEAMQKLDIYPNIWDRGEEELDYCLHYFGELQDFMENAARHQRAILIFIG